MSIEESGPNPERLAAAIHTQLNLIEGPTPVMEVARALGIVDIRYAPVTGFEAALICEAERGEGGIIVNENASPQRRLFSVAHELGHFLNLWHEPIESEEGFACRKTDIGGAWRPRSRDASRHARQEAEANCFAIELLAPEKLTRPFMTGIPDLAKVLRLANALELSKEAAARRYAERHAIPCALVFSVNGAVRYIDRRDAFPFVILRNGDRMPDLPPPSGHNNISDHVEVETRDWLARAPSGDLIAQTLHQQNGYAITLLMIDRDADDVDDS